MTSYINVKNKAGLTKLATIIKQAGFNAVKVTVKSKSITLSPSTEVDLRAGVSDLKAGRYISFKTVNDAADFLEKRIKKPKKVTTSKK